MRSLEISFTDVIPGRLEDTHTMETAESCVCQDPLSVIPLIVSWTFVMRQKNIDLYRMV